MAITYEPIATTTLSSSSSLITFTSIPQTYTDLQVVFNGKAPSASSGFSMYFNNDNTLNYSGNMIAGLGTSVSSATYSTSAGGYAIYGNNWTSLDATYPGTCIFDIFSYTNAKRKSCLIKYSNDLNGSGSIEISSGMWLSTAAINRIDLLAGFSFASGTTATIYGIKAA